VATMQPGLRAQDQGDGRSGGNLIRISSYDVRDSRL
jgi:hypothetical protein